MSNLSQRLSKLEPPPQHSEYLREVGLRLFRNAIETRHLVQFVKLTKLAWSDGKEAIYQEWTQDPSFEAKEREILSALDEPKPERTTSNA